MLYSVCLTAIIRFPYISELHFWDVTWSVGKIGLWVNVECNVGIMCACLPLLRPVFAAVIPWRVFPTSSATSQPPSYVKPNIQLRSWRRDSQAEDKHQLREVEVPRPPPAEEDARPPTTRRPTGTNWFSRSNSLDDEDEEPPLEHGVPEYMGMAC